jgi:hypothetical protein
MTSTVVNKFIQEPDLLDNQYRITFLRVYKQVSGLVTRSRDSDRYAGIGIDACQIVQHVFWDVIVKMRDEK